MNPAEYKSLREQVGSQHRAADLLGISRATIAGREVGTRRIVPEAAMCAAVGGTHIGDTEDMEAKEDAFDEWMEGKWKAIRAVELKCGDKMRDAAGDAIKIDGVYPAGGDTVFVQSGSLSMHIPKNGVVLILPNAKILP